MIDFGTPPPISLRSSDLGIALWEGKIKGELQLANSRILVIDHHDQQVTAFDLTGTLIGNASFLEDERKGTWKLEPEQHTAKTRAQILNERVFLSSRGKIYVWNLRGHVERVLKFASPITLVAVLEDRLILAFENDPVSLIAVANLDGVITSRWGSKLVEPRNPDNSWANEFFATVVDGGIAVFFLYHPIVRVYDLQGNLLDEGRYELRPRSKTNPPLEQLEELEEEFLDDRYPLILNIRAASDNQHWVVYNACHFGILDSSFQLIHLERICGPAQGYIPHVLDIDTSHARLLVMNQTSKASEMDKDVPIDEWDVPIDEWDVPVSEWFEYGFHPVGVGGIK